MLVHKGIDLIPRPSTTGVPRSVSVTPLLFAEARLTITLTQFSYECMSSCARLDAVSACTLTIGVAPTHSSWCEMFQGVRKVLRMCLLSGFCGIVVRDVCGVSLCAPVLRPGSGHHWAIFAAMVLHLGDALAMPATATWYQCPVLRIFWVNEVSAVIFFGKILRHKPYKRRGDFGQSFIYKKILEHASVWHR